MSILILAGLFLVIVCGGASIADWTGLEHLDWTVAPQTLPIILLALVYHDLTPGTLANEDFNLLWQFKILRLQNHLQSYSHVLGEFTVNIVLSISHAMTVVCAQLGGDIGRIRMSILLGSFVPLAMFLSWDAVALCLNPLSGEKDPIDVFMRSVPLLASVSCFAVLTAFDVFPCVFVIYSLISDCCFYVQSPPRTHQVSFGILILSW